MTESLIRNLIREELDLAIKRMAGTSIQILDTDEAMRYLGVKNRTTLTRYHQQGLPYIKGTPNRYVLSDLNEFAMRKRICLNQ